MDKDNKSAEECCKEKMIFKHNHKHNYGGGNTIYYL